jgi:asparagine synthase (glutamine-hydrolysing)
LNARRHEFASDIERFEASALASRMLDLPRLKRLVAEWPKDEQAAQARASEYNLAFARGMHIGRFIRWVEGGNG